MAAVELKEMITQHNVYVHALNVLRSVEAQQTYESLNPGVYYDYFFFSY